MSTIVEFLLARIAEDEVAAHNEQEFNPGAWEMYPFPPDRVLDECQAKRAIIDLIAVAPQSVELGRDVLEEMAAVYLDHPDYREEWRA